VPIDLSHHPDAPCFREHVFYWKGRYWCKGCVLSICGIVASIGLQLLTGWLNFFREEILGLIFLTLVLPAVVCALLGAPRKVKHVARFFLGLAFGSALMTFFITDRWLVRVVLVIAFFGIRIPLERRRHRQNAEILKQYQDEQSRAAKAPNTKKKRGKRPRK